jgi:hypothetical protein
MNVAPFYIFNFSNFSFIVIATIMAVSENERLAASQATTLGRLV